MTSSAITPFRLEVPQEELDDLRARLDRTRYTEELSDPKGDYGIGVAPIRELVDRWRTSFDWRAFEERLNARPQFTTQIDGQNVHFIHVRSSEENAVPLVLTHGWPGSVLEFLDIIDPLTEPSKHGREGGVAFDVVIPSIPGFALSGPTTESGWDNARIARAWAELMSRLGYEKFIAHGNDFGAGISPEIGRFAPDRVLGVHVNQVYSFPTGDPAEFASMSPEELSELQVLQAFSADKMAYNDLHSTQPQTLAHALADSPVGQLAWSYQLFGPFVPPEFVLGNVGLYWFTRTTASSMRGYWENHHVPAESKPTEPTTVPMGVAAFAGDFSGIRQFADRDHSNIVSWNTYDRGGHYPSIGAAEELVDDLRSFAAKVRPA